MAPEIPIEQFSIFAANLDHPECIAFDRDGCLWAGGEAGQIYRIDRAGTVNVIANLGGFCAGLAFSPAGELYVCNPALGIVRVTADGRHTVFAREAGGVALRCPNFGVFDLAGNYYVTDSGQWQACNGRLLRFNASGRNEVLADGLGYANGLAITADEKVLFMVESDTDSVHRFTLQPGGAVAPAGTFATDCGRFPDGLALDAAGNLYVCCYASDEIWRIAPGGGKTLLAWDRWGIRLGSPTNMAFGGENFDELYVANLARTSITRARLGQQGQPLAHQRTLHHETARP